MQHVVTEQFYQKRQKEKILKESFLEKGSQLPGFC